MHFITLPLVLVLVRFTLPLLLYSSLIIRDGSLPAEKSARETKLIFNWLLSRSPLL